MHFEASEISRSYPTAQGLLPALLPTSFTVGRGEFVSLVGPSGCGKSTLLAICSGLERPTTGEIRLDGRPLTRPGRERGMVFQNYTLFPWLTVRQNVLFSHRLGANRFVKSTASAQGETAYADHLIEVMGLAKFAARLPRELSGGMQQRAAIARALSNHPEILLMDEPFGALDAQTREEMQELMLLLSRSEGTTVLFVTHDIEESIYLSDRILVFSAHPGRVVAEITPPFGRERDLEIKLSAPFLQLKREIVERLRHHERPTFDRALFREKLARMGKLSEPPELK